MTIICPKCATPYRLPAGMIPVQKSAAKCKKCGARMIISPEKHAAKDESLLLPAAENELFLPPPETDGEDAHSAFPGLADLPADKFKFSEIFSKNKSGSFRNRNNILKVKLLKAVAPVLTENILHPDEQVLNIAKGSAYHLFEIPYANGILTLPTNYFAIVCTNFRLILINVDFKLKKPARYIYQIFYEEIVGLGRGIFLTSLIIQTRNGKSWNFTTVRRSLSHEIKTLILSRKKEGASGIFDGVSRSQLCPLCHTAISGYPSSCPGCKTVFKDPALAFKKSLLLPGLGSIYLGYTHLAVTEIFLYFASWLVLSSLAYMEFPGIIPLSIFILLILHGTAGLMSLKLGQKGFIAESSIDSEEVPAEKTVANNDLNPVI